MSFEDLEKERKAFEVLQAALELPEAQRVSFIEEHSQNDPRLLKRVLTLLRSGDPQESPFFTGGAGVYLADLEVPDHIGGYRIVEEIGRGGMGAVYLGKRASDDFEHDVAIKVVRSDQASKDRTERLRHERRLLAQLRHPNIAQLYDGGELEDGRPFFIMELVEGQSLAHALQNESLTQRKKLRIFDQICEAISYAHTKGIIHRDLSPSNVLIDGEKVKLIDFGISSLADTSETGVQFRGTKGFVAPERGSDQSPSTLEDVYSLGAILQDVITISKFDRISDLKAIVSKCMKSDPSIRYKSVSELQADLVAYHSRNPVKAVDGGWGYQLSRHAGKHKLLYSTGVMAFTGLLFFTAALAFLYQRASTAEQLAEDRFQDVRSIANFVVFDLHDEVSRLDGSTQAREALIVRSVQYLEGLERTASSSPELLLDLAEGYKRLADVVGNPQDSNLGDRNRSNDFLNRAKAALETYPEELRGQPRALRTFIGVEAARAARIGFTDNDYGQATQLALQTQDASNLLLQSDDRALEDQKVDAYLDTLLGYLFLQQENVDDSVSAMRQALEKYQSLADAHPERADLRYELGRTHTLLGESMAWQAYYEGQHYLDALEQMAIGIDFLRELNETETTEPGTRKELINSMLKYAASGCVQEGQRIQTLSYLDKTEVLLSSFALANPNDQWAKDNFATVIGYRLLCLQGLSRIDDAYQVAKRFEDVQRSDLARNPNEPEQLRWYADGMSLVRGAYAQLGYGEQACEIAREIETAWRKRDALSVEDTTEYSLTKRQENDTVLSTCT